MMNASVLITPNIFGADGISRLSRQFAVLLPAPTVVVSLHDASSPPIDGLPPVHGAGGHRARFVAQAVAASRRTAAETIVVCVHVHLAPVARVAAWRARPPVFVLCGIESWTPLRPAQAWALRGGDVIAISHHTAARFKAANPDFAGTAVEVCHPGLPDVAAAGDGGSSTSDTALIVGRMAANENYQGHDLLLSIWPEVRRRHPAARLCIVGDGDDRPRLEARARGLGLGDAVTFTGRVSDAELERLYRSSAFCVMPSRDEGFGLVFLEAMRAGRACVGASGAAAEIIAHGDTGYIVAPDDAEGLTRAIATLFADPLARGRMGAAGRARFTSDFTDGALADRLDAALRRFSHLRESRKELTA